MAKPGHLMPQTHTHQFDYVMLEEPGPEYDHDPVYIFQFFISLWNVFLDSALFSITWTGIGGNSKSTYSDLSSGIGYSSSWKIDFK